MPNIGEQEIYGESLDRLGFHPATDVSRPRHIEIRRHFIWLDSWVTDNLPDSREKSLARTALQEAAMWSNAAVAINLAPVVIEDGTFDN